MATRKSHARGIGRRLAAGAALAGALLALSATPAWSAGLKLVSTHRLDSRLSELTFSTPALSSDTGVRVLVPRDYAVHRRHRYPVLYLLNGALGNETDWTQLGNAEALTKGLDAIVVMPSGGRGGYYSNWWNFGQGGPPEWETYHTDQIVPWIDAHYRTIARRGERAIAGLSMGGFGAFSYAARHPDLFAIAASFSGALDTNDPQPTGQPDGSTLDGGRPNSTWGPYQTERVRWRAHDPLDLAANLRGLDLMMLTGNGRPGGPYPWNPVGGAVESFVHQENTDMNARLDALGIALYYDDYGAGDHSWPYWQRDLAQVLPMITADFAHPPAAPKTVTFTAAESSYAVYGWTVAMRRPVVEFSTLKHASARGFALAGSGAARVTTPAAFTPGRAYVVTVTLSNGHAKRVTLRASRSRRLRIHVPLGPPNPFNADTPGATTRVYTTQVEIRR